MIKRFTILISLLIVLTGCNPSTQDNNTDQIPDFESNRASDKTANENEEIVEGRCPDPAIPAILHFGHHVEQNYLNNSIASDANGSVPINIGTQGVNGSGEMEMVMGGTFSGGKCIASGSNSAVIDINGVCKDGVLELMITETYSGGSFTLVCDDDASTSGIPGTTINHEIVIPLQDGKTVSAPFVGEAGSGTYNWTLDLLLGGDYSGDDIETVPLVPEGDIENVPLVPMPTS